MDFWEHNWETGEYRLISSGKVLFTVSEEMVRKTGKSAPEIRAMLLGLISDGVGRKL